jgi:hypothetical protein
MCRGDAPRGGMRARRAGGGGAVYSRLLPAHEVKSKLASRWLSAGQGQCIGEAYRAQMVPPVTLQTQRGQQTPKLSMASSSFAQSFLLPHCYTGLRAACEGDLISVGRWGWIAEALWRLHTFHCQGLDADGCCAFASAGGVACLRTLRGGQLACTASGGAAVALSRCCRLRQEDEAGTRSAVER